jgi:hypothetical protein
MSVDAKLLTVVNAIKQSLQMSGGPGSSVNTHPNPFFLNVTGEINLKHMAELVITRVEEHEALIKAKTEAAIQKADAEAAKAEAEAPIKNTSEERGQL